MGEGRLLRRPRRRRLRLVVAVVGLALVSGCGSSGGGDDAVEREPASPLVDGQELTVSSLFAVSGRSGFNHVEASETRLLGFGGIIRGDGVDRLRTGGELVDLVEGTSTELTFPVVDESTFFPYGAVGLGPDFVLVGHLCSSPEDVYNEEFEGDPCAPRTPAAFLLHEDGTWEEMALPDELGSSRVASVRLEASGDGVVAVLTVGEDGSGESVVLRLSEGTWRVVTRIPVQDAYSCATATHLYRFEAGSGDEAPDAGGAAPSQIFRYDLGDGEEEVLPLPELPADLDPGLVGLACNDAFPILTTDVVDGTQTVHAFTDEKWTIVEGIVAATEPADLGELLSYPRGIITSMEPTEPGSTEPRRYFLVDEELQVTELPADQLTGKIVRRTGDDRFLVLVRNWDAESEEAPTDDLTTTPVQVMAI